MTLKSILAETDPQVYSALTGELKRQQNNLELIASENFTSEAVLKAVSSVFTNKYAEGYPEKRYYGGCEFADQIESLAISRAKKLFSAEHANVQPHCGSSANMAAYLSVLKPGDSILGMELSHGGHLTHGSPVNFSGTLFNNYSYGVKEDTEIIDYDKVLQIAEEKKPKVIIAGSSAYPRIIDFSVFKEAAKIAGGATFIVDMAHFAGLVAAGLYPSPLPMADIVTTTTHKTLRGPRGGIILCRNHLAKKIDDAVFPGIQGGPLMHVIAAKAVALGEALTPNFIDYQSQVIKNASRLAQNLIDAGFRLVSGGTDTHLILIDLSSQNITGAVAESALEKAGLTTNKNTIPFDKQSYKTTSGLRIGTPAITTRGMKELEMDTIAEFIIEALNNYDNDNFLAKIKVKVEELCNNFPLYPNLQY